MKKHLLFTIFILCFGCSSTHNINNLVTNSQDYEEYKITKKQSDLIFEKAKVFPNETQISIALIKNGVPKYYGIRKVNDTIMSINNYTNVFEIGSITKVFTATLLSSLVVQNEIKLEETINKYIEFPFKDNQQIKFKELANHTSGLPGMPTNFDIDLSNSNPIAHLDNTVIKDYLTNELELSHKVLTKYSYSNLGAGLLSYTLSEVTDSDYLTLLQDHIFSKYDMTKSTIGIEEIKSFLIKGRNSKGEPTQNWDLGSLAGAGAIISSVEDLSKFAIAQFDNKNKELELTRKKTYWISPVEEIGLGWHIRKKIGRDDLYWHNGGTGGYTSCMIFNPLSQNSVIVLSNVSTFREDMDNIDKICFELMKTLELD